MSASGIAICHWLFLTYRGIEMANDALNTTRAKQSMTVLANAASLIANAVFETMGNDISDSLNGSRLTLQALNTHAANRIRSVLNKKITEGQ
jgi:hypothetical protein